MQSPPLPASLHTSLSTPNSFCSLLENGSFHPPAGANCTRGWIEELSLGEDSVVFDCLQPQWTEAHQAPLSMGFFQARILERVAIPFSRGSSQPRDGMVSSVTCTGRQVLDCWATWEALRLFGGLFGGSELSAQCPTEEGVTQDLPNLRSRAWSTCIGQRGWV